MSSSSGSTVDQSNHRSWSHCGGRRVRNSNWSGVNTAAMIVGFVFFWPIGLFILYWIISGRNVQELPQKIAHLWSTVSTHIGGNSAENPRSGNVVFNAFQNTQYDRIREIKEEIKARSQRFRDFRADAKRRADQEEFNNFMSSTPNPIDG